MENPHINLWKLLDLFNQWEEIQNICEKTIGSGIKIISPTGENVLEKQYSSPLCHLILNSKQGYEKCISSYMDCCFCEKAFKEGFCIFKCHAGLINFSAPIIIHQKSVGAIIGGGIITNSINEDKYKNYMEEIGVNSQKAIELFHQIKKIPTNEFTTFSKMIRLLIDPLKEAINTYHSLIEKAESINELIKEKEKLHRVDELTGLHNRSYMWERLEEEISRAIRKNHPLSIIIVNIDNFKRINDLYGHSVCNSILKEITDILLHYTRKEDVLVRAGSDEFVIILIDITEDKAAILANRIQSEIDKHPFCQSGNLNIFLNISCGISTLTDKTSTPKELMNNAKQALYTAKSKDKEKIITFSKVEKGIPFRCVITGIGIISPIGIGKEVFWQSTCAGKSGVSRITGFDTTELPVKIAGEVKDFNPLNYMDIKSIKRTDRTTQFAVAATKMAIEDAYLDLSKEDTEKIGVIIGAGMGGLAFGEEQHLRFLKEGAKRVSPFLSIIIFGGACSSVVSLQFGLKGPSITISTGCSAGSDAIGHAFERIKKGEGKIMIAGGAEAPIRPIILTSFEIMGALSSRNDDPEHASRPFDANRDGFVLGEGAGIIILEELEHALNRNAHIYAELVSYVSTGDAYHMSAPAPDGKQAARAITLALKQANLKPEDIDYINAHGSSTPLNDRTETLIIKNVFGEHAYRLKVSSTKSMLGHSIGACGGIELISCLLGIENNLIPPTINYEYKDPDCDLDYVPNIPCQGKINVAMSNSFGFGGKNAILVVKMFNNGKFSSFPSSSLETQLVERSALRKEVRQK